MTPPMTTLDLARQLIAFPSTSGRELPLVTFVSGLLRERGIAHVVDSCGATANLYVSMGKGEDILLLYAHTDVVPGPGTLFAPRVEDGRLFGRGAADMKSALAGLVQVLLEDAEVLRTLPYTVLFAFVAEEETTGQGIRQFVRWFGSRGRQRCCCVLMEPSEDFTALYTGGKGSVFLDLEGTMADVLASFRAILARKPELLAAYPDLQDGFGRPTLELTKLASSAAFQGEHLQGKASHASRPDSGENAIEKALTLHGDITCLHSSDTEGPNSLPASVTFLRGDSRYGTAPCRAHVDIRTNLAADAGDRLFRAVDALIHPGVQVLLRNCGKAYRTSDRRLIDLCIAAQGGAVEERISTGGGDAPYLLPITGSVIAGFGPGSRHVAHSDEECVDLRALEATPGIIRNLIRGFGQR